jgi:uncharacterized protein YlbG (UPF0298 family)
LHGDIIFVNKPVRYYILVVNEIEFRITF